MKIADIKKCLADSNRQFAAVLEQCKAGDFGDPMHTALAVSKLSELFQEVLSLQEQLLLDMDDPQDPGNDYEIQ